MGILDIFFKTKKETKQKTRTVIKNDVEYKYVKNKRAKALKIRVKDRFHVYVTIPYSISYKTAEAFVLKHSNLLNETLLRYETDFLDENFKTKTNNLKIEPALVKTPTVSQKSGVVTFLYPLGADFYSKEIQTALKGAIKKALYIEAKNYLPKRLNYLALKFGFKYGKLALKTNKTRWGSCSYRNNINLNINLMALEDEFIDYVILHELVHTVEKNHGAGFWKKLYSIMPNAAIVKKRLKEKKMTV